jgi:hypothetical protein
MKFSEAMLLGLPEIKFTNNCTLIINQNYCTGCLVGAALWACGARETSGKDVIARYWPRLAATEFSFDCTLCGVSDGGNVWDFCTHYANHYVTGQISAQAIADLIREFEPAESEESAATPEVLTLEEELASIT